MGRKKNGFTTVKFSDEISLGTLAGNTGLGENVPGLTPDEDVYLISGDFLVGMDNHIAEEGPLEILVAHSDYTDSEIEAWIESTTSMTRTDLVAQEVARRKIRSIGMLSGVTTQETMNHGQPIRTKLRFLLHEAASLQLYCYNHMNAALTGSTVIVVSGTIFYRR